MPKFKLLYFKNLLDIAFNKFFDLYNNDFIKDGTAYVLAKKFNTLQLTKIFNSLLTSCLVGKIEQYDILKPTYTIIIGECMPKNNILLKVNDASRFPNKLKKIISSDFSVKYALREKDICLDILKFNEVCENAFKTFFSNNGITKYFGKEYKKNLMFIQHSQLDAYTLFKTLKHILGKANCINLHDQSFNVAQMPLVSINEMIDKYSNKNALNKYSEFDTIVNEIQTYIKESIGYGN